MARSRRPRATPSDPDDSFRRFVASFPSTQTRREHEWVVQTISAAQAQKDYRCPGCGRTVAAGTAHLVAWRADGIMGEAADLAARRHWHTHCWRIG